jgi:hypothetical protein
VRRLVVLILVIELVALAILLARDEPVGVPFRERPESPERGVVPSPPRDRAPADAVAASAPSCTEAPPADAIVGIVRDARGAPVVGAEVAVYVADERRWKVAHDGVCASGEPVARTATAVDGEFSLSRVAGGKDPLVVVRKHGYATAAARDNGEWMFVKLQAADPRTIQVVDGVDRPVAGAEIALRGELLAIRDAVTTGAAGEARLIAEEGADVVVRARGLATRKWVELAAPKDGTPQRIVMHEGRSISGVVVDSAGDPPRRIGRTIHFRRTRPGRAVAVRGGRARGGSPRRRC